MTGSRKKQLASPSGPSGPTPAPPGMPMPPMPQAGGSIDPLSATIFSLNMNPYLIGIFMILLNLGARFLPMELTKQQEGFLQNPWVRPFILFVVIFIGTRNLAVAFWLTLLVFSVVWFFANEKSPYCMIPGWCEQPQEPPKEESTLYEKNLNHIRSHLNYVPEYKPMLDTIVTTR